MRIIIEKDGKLPVRQRTVYYEVCNGNGECGHKHPTLHDASYCRLFREGEGPFRIVPREVWEPEPAWSPGRDK